MECPNCGSELSESAKFCTLCFTKFDAPGQTAVAPAAPDMLPLAEQGSALLPQPQQAAGEPALPPDELARLNEFRGPIPRPGALQEMTLGRKAAIIAGGSVISAVAGYILGMLPVPFAAMLGPFLGGAFVGYMLDEDGGRYGLLAAAIPAIIGAIGIAIISSALMGSMASEAAKSTPGISTGALSNALSGLLWYGVVIAVGMQCLAGMFGGMAGEHYADSVR